MLWRLRSFDALIGGEDAIAGLVPIETGQPVATLQQLGPALTRCFRAPSGSTGSQITIRFSLNSAGAIIGRPMVTYSKLVGSPDDKAAFAEAALRAVAACTPVPVTASFGASIAGRILSVRFIGGRTQPI